MSRLDRFMPTECSDNRVETLHIEKIDDIIIGASCTHIFSLGFTYSSYVKSSKIIYKQGLKVVLIKYPKDFNLEETDDGHTFLTLNLLPEDTLKFKDSLLDTTVQLQIVTKAGETLYNIPSKLIIKKPTGVECYKPASLTKIKDFVYSAEFDFVDYDAALQSFYGKEIEASIGGCSSIRSGNFYGRNLDWFNNYEACFLLRCTGKKYKSLGVAGGISKLTQDYIDEYEYSDIYKLIPFFTFDGINENGVVCNINVVPGNDLLGGAFAAYASVQTRYEIFSPMLTRYVLDNFSTAKEAVEYLRDYVNVIVPASLKKLGYATHWMIADNKDTFVIEIINGRLNILEENIMTNFYLSGVEFNADHTVYTPYDISLDSTKNAITKNHITKKGLGLERYNMLRNRFEQAGKSMADMRKTINCVRYSLAYTHTEDTPCTNEYPFFTEWVGDYQQENMSTKKLTVASTVPDILTTGLWEADDGGQKVFYPSVIEYQQAKYKLGKMEKQTGTWISNTSSVYDIANKKLNIIFWEDEEELKYTL